MTALNQYCCLIKQAIEIFLCDILFLVNTKNGFKITDRNKIEYTSPRSFKATQKIIQRKWIPENKP